MTERAKIVRHLDRLANHVMRRLQTTGVFKWMRTGQYPDLTLFDADVREAVAKIRRLQHRYYLIWLRSNEEPKCGMAPFNKDTDLTIFDCCASELKWVVDMWRYGDWGLVRRDEKGQSWQLGAFEDGKIRWKVSEVSVKLRIYNISTMKGIRQ